MAQVTQQHTFYLGNTLDVLKTLPDESVQCVVSSPPYFGLRSYGTDPQVWGGDPACQHEWIDLRIQARHDKTWASNSPEENRPKEKTAAVSQGCFCSKCGAWLGELGLEPDPWLFVEHLVMVFREVHRVLRRDGTLWLNIADTYARNPQKGDNSGWGKHAWVSDPLPSHGRAIPVGMKAKDLIGIPWMIGLALRADGWYLRSSVIWGKQNCMPESVTDRPTRSHEYIFLLTKSGSPKFWTHPERDGVRKCPAPDYAWVNKWTGEIRRNPPADSKNWRRKNLWKGHDYFYDGDAIREPYAEDSLARAARGRAANPKWADGGPGGQTLASDPELRNACSSPLGRNRRDLWVIPTEPFSGRHFATFPEELVATCILAGSPEVGACPKCGAPWTRRVQTIREPDPTAGQNAMRGAGHFREGGTGPANREGRVFERTVGAYTVGWAPTCSCGLEPAPATVGDFFGGSGTVSVVAQRYGRSSIYVDLKSEYRQMAIDRMQPEQPSLVQPFEIVTKEVAG